MICSDESFVTVVKFTVINYYISIEDALSCSHTHNKINESIATVKKRACLFH